MITYLPVSRQPLTQPKAPPSPRRPAQPVTRVGTQDSPVLAGQKPGAVPVPPRAQPRRRSLLAWWQEAWGKAKRERGTSRVKIEAAEKDLARRLPSVVGDEFSDVITPTRHPSNQGSRPEAPLFGDFSRWAANVRKHVEAGHEGFVSRPLRLSGVVKRVNPVVPRSAVAPAIKALPLEVYENVQKNYR